MSTIHLWTESQEPLSAREPERRPEVVRLEAPPAPKVTPSEPKLDRAEAVALLRDIQSR